MRESLQSLKRVANLNVRIVNAKYGDVMVDKETVLDDGDDGFLAP